MFRLERKSDEHEFLPAALEIQHSPPSPVGRSIIWTIIALFVIAVVWSIIGKVDIVAVARGEVVPAGRVKVIQPMSTSEVSEIHVRNGQQVEQGEVLIELDPTLTTADRDRLEAEVAAVDAELQRNRRC